MTFQGTPAGGGSTRALLESASAATELDLVSQLMSIPDARMGRGVRFPAWDQLLVAVIHCADRPAQSTIRAPPPRSGAPLSSSWTSAARLPLQLPSSRPVPLLRRV